jgi:hypothetical protein
MDLRRALPLGVTILGLVAACGLVGRASPPPETAEAGGVEWLQPSEIAGLFARPGPHTQDGETVATSVIEADRIDLPTGRIVAGDVFLGGSDPLDRAFEPGLQPVRLLMVRFEDGGDVVAAVAIGAPDRVARWLPAFGAAANPDGTTDPLGFAVDSGTAGYASAETAALYDDDAGTDRILERLQAGSTDAGFTWLSIEPGSSAGTTSMIAVASGYGDGAYPVWWGLDAQGRPVALLTDFGVLF